MSAHFTVDSSAAYLLGCRAEMGIGMPQDVGRAAALYAQSAAHGHPNAAYRTALFYETGIVLNQPSAVSTRLYEQAVQAGVTEAFYARGLCARAGRGCVPDDGDAYRYFLSGADRSVQCAFETGRCLYEGRGVLRDTQSAVTYLESAVRLWQAQSAQSEAGKDSLAYALHNRLTPPGGLSDRESAAEALFLLGINRLNAVPLTETDISLSYAYLEQAAAVGHSGAYTVLGDLTMWGTGNASSDWHPRTDRVRPTPADLLPHRWDALSPADRQRAIALYKGAAEADTPPAASLYPRGRTDALLSLALEAYARADALYAAAESDGSADAHTADAHTADAHTADAVGMSYLTLAYRCGDRNRHYAALLMAVAIYAKRYRNAENASEKERLSLVRGLLSHIDPQSAVYPLAMTALGDLTLSHGSESQMGTEGAEANAARLYRIALQSGTDVSSFVQNRLLEGGTYRLFRRGESVRMMTARVKQGILYRLARLTALYPTVRDTKYTGSEDTECFVYLTQAVMSGFEQADEDLARMLYAVVYDREGGEDTWDDDLYDRIFNGDDDLGIPRPASFMKAYYDNDPRRCTPFIMRALMPSDGDMSAVSRTVTPSMRAVAMNYMGECYYYGRFVPISTTNAVRCYRIAADTRLSPQDPAFTDVAWAQYSLGCCLINGTGCATDARKGVAYLTAAAKTNGAAACMLASCYESGIGVDPGDYRYYEAFSLYRKAVSLGFEEAEEKLKALKKKLR